MHICRLSLENFRNFSSIDLPLTPGRTVVYGDNAQGKSNLLEAIYTFATGKSAHAEQERDLINWTTLAKDIPFTRLRGDFSRNGAPLKLEIVIQLSREALTSNDDPDDAQLQKRIRLNGAPKRAVDVVGEAQVVLFEPQDIELVYGSPSSRRRHLDLTLSQIDRALLRELQRYARVLAQRNSLLKAIREGRARPPELIFWDQELVNSGSLVMLARARALADLNPLANAVHHDLTAQAEELAITYLPSVALPSAPSLDNLATAFRGALAQTRQRELAAGVTLSGPHRDDFGFEINGRNLASFGSRGQHRLATLSLKLAEAQLMTKRAGRQPILLLDDILSELDPARRSYLLAAIANYEQAILTTADIGALRDPFLAQAARVHVVQGSIAQLA